MAPIYLYARQASANEVALWSRAWVKGGASLIAVDYIQNLRGDSENRTVQVTVAIQTIKALAVELNMPFVVLAQYNRAAESRAANARWQRRDEDEAAMPRVTDLADSSEIEKSADVVLFIQHTHVSNGVCDLIVAKHRNGGNLGMVTVKFDSVHAQFSGSEKK